MGTETQNSIAALHQSHPQGCGLWLAALSLSRTGVDKCQNCRPDMLRQLRPAVLNQGKVGVRRLLFRFNCAGFCAALS